MTRLLFLLALTIPALPAAAQDVPGQPPCMADDSHRAFDFWIGDWEVTQPNGKVAGTNRIDRILGGCVLQENWVGAGGSAGKSFNWFDAAAAEWRQLWVDSFGGHMDYRGQFGDGAMRFQGLNVNPDGSSTLMRMTFTPLDDGRVRQFIEQSTDEGATWATWFDGYYTRRDS